MHKTTKFRTEQYSTTKNCHHNTKGVGSDDKVAFYQWCKTNHKGEMQDAVMKQLHSNEVSGWKPLADRYLAATAPSLIAFKAAGGDSAWQSGVHGWALDDTGSSRAGWAGLVQK